MSLKYALLSQVSLREQSGYDIVKSFELSTGYFWNATHQQVYRELNKLYKNKLISLKIQQQTGKPDRKLYRINKSGTDALLEWMRKPLPKQKVSIPLLVKVQAAASVGTSELVKELTRSRESTRLTLKSYLEIEQCYQPPPDEDSRVADQVLYIALRKGITSAQSHLEWLEEALGLLLVDKEKSSP